jgi:hypothetical protein
LSVGHLLPRTVLNACNQSPKTQDPKPKTQNLGVTKAAPPVSFSVGGSPVTKQDNTEQEDIKRDEEIWKA